MRLPLKNFILDDNFRLQMLIKCIFHSDEGIMFFWLQKFGICECGNVKLHIYYILFSDIESVVCNFKDAKYGHITGSVKIE